MMQKMTKSLFFICLTIILSTFNTNSQNFINNGDFESGGNGVGFNINSCCYNAVVPSGTTVPGNYAVTNNPFPMNTANFLASTDHTSGTGNMLVVDGTNTGGQQRFWRAGNTGGGACGLTVGTTYTFSFWIKSVSSTVTGPATQAAIGIAWNNANSITLTSVNTVVGGFVLAPLPAVGWQQVVYTFVPTNACVNIEMYDNNTSAAGNDFAVDDFVLVGPPVPLSLSYSFSNPTCPGSNNGSIIGYGKGGVSPYSYTLAGTSGGTNATGVFTGLTPGTYSIAVTDNAGITVTQSGIIITDPTDLTVSANTSICAGTSTTLSVSGGAAPYTWTAVPADVTLTTPNSATPTVSPAVTTVYTATSNTSALNNLAYNGNFSLGNQGFTTDYNYFNPTNPSLAQRAYGIVTSANVWESSFSPCTDHTGAGNMMVVDGSTFNSGNDRLWCQTIPVTAGQNYTFSYWVQTVSTTNPGNLDVVINGTSVGTSLAPAGTCSWIQRTYAWNSGASTTAQICIYDRNTATGGNDFAIDDITFTGTISCTLQKAVTITVTPKPTITATVTTQTSCTVPTGIITVSAPTGANYEYSINGTAYQSGTTFSGLTANTYPVTVRNITTTCVSSAVNLTINAAAGVPNISGSTSAGPNCTIRLTGNSVTPGVTITWSGPGLPANSPNPSFAAVTGSYTVTAFDPVSGCSNTANVNVSIPLGPNAPTVTSTQPTCTVLTGTITITAPLGANVQYSINGTTFQASPIFLLVPAGTYNVIAKNTATSCLSLATPVTLTAPLSQSPPTVSPDPLFLCQTGPAPQLTATAAPGATLIWYGAFATGGVGSPIPTTPSLTTLGPTTYYVSQTNGICESPRVGIEVIVSATVGNLALHCDSSQVTGPNSVFFDWSNVTGHLDYLFSYSINGGPAITGSSGNLTHWEVFGLTPGQSVTLTITSVKGVPCQGPTSTTCTLACAVTTIPDFPVYAPICAGSAVPALPTSSPNGISGTWNPPTISNTASGSYVFTPNATLFPCALSVTRGVTVTPVTSAGTLSGTQNVCVGLTTTFSSTVAGGAWSSSDTTVATVNPTTGIITGVSAGPAIINYLVTGTGGCSNASTTRSITVNPLPIAGTLNGTQNVCVGLTTAFSSTVAGGVWSSSDATAATVNAIGIVTGVAAGAAVIKYEVTNAFGCKSNVTRTVTINPIPAAGTLSGTQNVCVGLTTTFSSTVTGGVWSSSNTAAATVNAATGVVTGVASGTANINYVVTSAAGCASVAGVRSVTVNPIPTAGTLSGIQNVCVGLTRTFSSTVAGGNWTSASTATATVSPTTGVVTGVASGTTTINYTVTSAAGCTSAPITRTITVDPIPNAGTLSGNQSICITQTTTFSSTVAGGVWSSSNTAAATVNAASGVITGVTAGTSTINYIVTSAAGCNSIAATRLVTVNPTPVPGTLSGTQNVCVGLTTTFSSSVAGGAWTSQNPAIATVNPTTGVVTGVTVGTATINYVVTSAAGCPSPAATRSITVNPIPNAGTLSGNQNICIGQTTTYSSTVMGGNWTSANTAVATVNPTTGAVTGVTAGTAVINYTVTNAAGCVSPAVSRSVNVNTNILPTFTPIAPICSGNALAPLPTTSLEGITGIWTPALNNTLTTNYIFHPTAGQCATTAPLTIVVKPRLTPIFDPISVQCLNDTNVPVLPLVSQNGITGTWNPPTVSLAATGTLPYTFVPNPSECVTPTPVRIFITVVAITTPNFPNYTFCEGKTPIPTLDTTSPNGVEGTWSPAVISNTVSGSYTFTPNTIINQCATQQVITVTVIKKTVPDFPAVAPFCVNTTAPILNPVSPNGVAGTWSPAIVDNTVEGTSTYLFTPNTGLCATTKTLDITVTPPLVTDFSDLTLCKDIVPPLLNPVSPNGINGTWSPATIDTGFVGTTPYLFTPNTGECGIAKTFNVTIKEYNLNQIEGIVSNYFDDLQVITVLASGPGEYLYQLDLGPLQESSVFENVPAGLHTITVFDKNSCGPSLSDPNIMVINYPKFFTPNGDGFNDHWNITGLADQPNSRIFIFDRYGKLIKEISPAGSGWDGTYNGNELPATDYWFTVDYLENTTPKQFKAHFSLKR
jgi:gliding motility-associated-like protein